MRGGDDAGPAGTDDRARDRAAIESVVADLSRAWRSGDGAAWGRCFTADADFTTWFGLRLSGREAISTGHQEIFESFYANTAYHLRVESVRFLSGEVALVALAGSVVGIDEEEPPTPHTVPLAVMVEDGGRWSVAAFQNTRAGEIDTRREQGDVRAE